MVFTHQDYWESIAQSIAWFVDGTLNAAHDALDKHRGTSLEGKTALIFESADGNAKEFTFGDLIRQSNQFANLLTHLGVGKEDRVFLFLPRIPYLYTSFFAALKTGAVAGTMFSAFGEQAIQDRLEDSKAKVIITTKELSQRIEPIKNYLKGLEHIVLVDDESFTSKLSAQENEFATVHTHPEDFAFMLYTSGTTGKPKGIVHAHYGILQQRESARLVLDLKPEDTYWCTADPGWVTGIVYSMLANWSLGVTTLIYEGRFDPKRWYQLIEKHKVTVWYTAPTAIRMLMAASDTVSQSDSASCYDLSSLRYLASVGEPLNPEAVVWSEKVFGIPFHDNWWQTETGSILIANTPEIEIKPGSMGKPLPFIDADIVDDEGNILPPQTEGNLAIKPFWPSIMRTVWQNKKKYESYFINGWYLTGDRAKKDEDGYFWFIGRADDVIKTSGERVGPFEVESALIDHKSVVEAGVIGKPDQLRGEIIKAFVVLKPGVEQSDTLKEELKEHVKKHLAGHAYPREIEFIDKLPKTRSGKIMRRILKAKELGLPIGDISTLEEY